MWGWVGEVLIDFEGKGALPVRTSLREGLYKRFNVVLKPMRPYKVRSLERILTLIGVCCYCFTFILLTIYLFIVFFILSNIIIYLDYDYLYNINARSLISGKCNGNIGVST